MTNNDRSQSAARTAYQSTASETLCFRGGAALLIAAGVMASLPEFGFSETAIATSMLGGLFFLFFSLLPPLFGVRRDLS